MGKKRIHGDGFGPFQNAIYGLHRHLKVVKKILQDQELKDLTDQKALGDCLTSLEFNLNNAKIYGDLWLAQMKELLSNLPS